MRGLGVASSAQSMEIASLMRQAKAAMVTINASAMPEGSKSGARASYNQLVADAEVLGALADGGHLLDADFRDFKQDVQGFLLFATDPGSFGVTAAPAPAPRVATPLVTTAPEDDPARSYLLWGGVAVGVVVLVGVAVYGSKKGWFKKGRRR